MTVNVFTYYENKLAFEKANKERARVATPKRKSAAAGTFARLGVVAGLTAGAVLYCLGLDPASGALAAGILAAWGGGLGSLLDWFGGRVRRFCDTLCGRPLDPAEVRDLVSRL